MNIWVKRGVISHNQFDEIQQVVDSFSVPHNVGRIPYKISSGFSSFKADQWCSWTVICSPIVLKDVLPSADYDVWCLFVNACLYASCQHSLNRVLLQISATLWWRQHDNEYAFTLPLSYFNI